MKDYKLDFYPILEFILYICKSDWGLPINKSILIITYLNTYGVQPKVKQQQIIFSLSFYFL